MRKEEEQKAENSPVLLPINETVKIETLPVYSDLHDFRLQV